MEPASHITVFEVKLESKRGNGKEGLAYAQEQAQPKSVLLTSHFVWNCIIWCFDGKKSTNRNIHGIVISMSF